VARANRHIDHDLDLGDRAVATIAVIADTHSRPHRDAVEQVAARTPDLILHAGDIGALSAVDRFGEVAPTVAVRGNIDGHEFPDTAVIRVARAGVDIAKILLMHIAVRGPRLRKDARTLAQRRHAQLVVCGHSHVPLIATESGVTVFNPGSIGPRRFTLPTTFGVVKISEDGIRLGHVDCETGERWFPPPS
jgi:hypothetical protein